ncbi:MAG: hypothetical protein M8353_05440 [ANME-2 cluster archaeon]|nr:hypothetical protein [ANME-2 cluster archaeon]
MNELGARQMTFNLELIKKLKGRKVMGWCPQKDFDFMHAGDTKHKTDIHDLCAGYGDAQNKRWKRCL